MAASPPRSEVAVKPAAAPSALRIQALLGPGFTVLTGRDGGAWRAAVSHASEVLGIPLAVHRIVDEQWAPTTGLAADGALLIRPDDFVGWRSESLPADPEIELQRALATILARI